MIKFRQVGKWTKDSFTKPINEIKELPDGIILSRNQVQFSDKVKRFSTELSLGDRLGLIKSGFRNGKIARDNIRNNKSSLDVIKDSHRNMIKSSYNYIGDLQSGEYDDSMTDVNKAHEVNLAKKSIKNSKKELKHIDKGAAHYANRMRSKHIRDGFKSALGF